MGGKKIIIVKINNDNNLHEKLQNWGLSCLWNLNLAYCKLADLSHNFTYKNDNKFYFKDLLERYQRWKSI